MTFPIELDLYCAGHTSRFLMLWLTFLPCILYRTCHLATPLAGAIISISLLGTSPLPRLY